MRLSPWIACRTEASGRRGLAVCLLASGVLLIAVPGAGATTFSSTGAEQMYTVPANAVAIHVLAVGAPGSGDHSTLGGRGAVVTADLPVSPNEVLYIEVGVAGAEVQGSAFGGGGAGAQYNMGTLSTPGGGGASDVRTCSMTAPSCGTGDSLSSRLLVAGGGGGAGLADGAPAGGAGGAAGVAGSAGAGTSGGGGGDAGGQSSGGTAGTSFGVNGPSAGTSGNGGPGAGALNGGGGGGGGYYGGGGGGRGSSPGADGGGGGGGGSSFIAAQGSNGSVAVDTSGTPTVTITAIVRQPLTVGLAGAGSGSVTGSGISCPSTCSSTYDDGTQVNLTAAAATGSTFAGWSGDCSGTGSCTVTMSAARNVTAAFAPNPAPTQFALLGLAATIPEKTAAASPSGDLVLRVTNPNNIAAKGRVTLAYKRHTKPLTLGRRSFTIGPHATVRVKVHLSSAGRALLRKRKTLRVSVRVVLTAAGKSKTTTRQITIKLRR